MRSYKFSDEPFEMHGINVLVSGTMYPGDPGRLFGPPEDCWPPEPDELEIDRVMHGGEDIYAALSSTFLDRCTDELIGRLVSQRVRRAA